MKLALIAGCSSYIKSDINYVEVNVKMHDDSTTFSKLPLYDVAVGEPQLMLHDDK